MRNQTNTEHIQRSWLAKNIHMIMLLLLVGAIICVIMTIYSYIEYFPGPITSDHNKWGTFGDFIGGTLNPILSFLAFIALLITIILQTQELSLSTKELASSAKALRDQSSSLKIQNFESTLFRMVGLHNDIVKDMDLRKIDGNDIIEQGRDCFRIIYKRFRNTVKENRRKRKYSDESALINSAYDEFFKKYQAEIGHYYRNLYNLIKFVKESEIENKKRYTNIVRAQLSSYELSVLFYNCIHDVGRKKFKPLIEEFELLENMDFEILINPREHIPFYNQSAFGDKDLSKYLQ